MKTKSKVRAGILNHNVKLVRVSTVKPASASKSRKASVK